MPTEKLKPCPFCGSTNIFLSYLPPGIKAYCHTNNCICGPTRDTPEDATEAWNRRVKDGQKSTG